MRDYDWSKKRKVPTLYVLFLMMLGAFFAATLWSIRPEWREPVALFVLLGGPTLAFIASVLKSKYNADAQRLQILARNKRLREIQRKRTGIPYDGDTRLVVVNDTAPDASQGERFVIGGPGASLAFETPQGEPDEWDGM
jgi:hypothetical protein